MCVLVAVQACASAPPRQTIDRDRAVAIARRQVPWQPFDITARQLAVDGRLIWRVTLKGRLPGQPPLLFETAIVEIDAKTGEVSSVAKT